MNSGKLRVSKDVQGRMRAAVANVQVYTSFDLTADRTQVPAGETASFTPMLDGAPGEASKWRWRGDSTDVPDPCAAIVNHVCQYAPAQSGTMWAYTAESAGDSASVHVTVVPCPIPDHPVLNDSIVRHDLMVLMSKSGWLLNPGDGIAVGDSVGNKRELAGDIHRRPDGSFYFAEDTLVFFSNECMLIRSTTDTRRSPTDVRVGYVHVHPTERSLVVYGCPPDLQLGVLARRGPWDTTRTYITRKAADSTYGGGSVEDWSKLSLLPENTGPNPSVSGYLLNADGEIWVQPAELIHTDQQFRNRTVFHWTLNQNSSCNW